MKSTHKNAAGVASLKSKIVPVGKEVELIDGLENLGKISGTKLTVDSITEQPLITNGTTAVLAKTMMEDKVHLTVLGSWDKVIKLWSLLGSYQYNVNFSSIDLFSSNDELIKGKPTTTWSAKFEVTIYKFK